MENDYRITKLHGTFIGDNRIPDLPAGEKTKVFSSTNGKTAWVDLPDGGIPIVEAEFSEELRSFILPTEQTTNFILHEESAGYFYINLIGGGAYSGFMTIPGTNIAYSLSGSGTMITLSTPVMLNIVSGTIVNGDTITIPSEQTGPFILSLELIGNVYVETYEATTTKYYGLSYRKDDEGDKLLILNGEGTTLTAKTFPLSGDNGIETIEVSNGTHNSDGSYTYTLPKKPTSNPYILKTVDSGESDYYLMTGDSEISFGMRPIALTDSLFGGNFMVVSGTTATQRPTNFPPQPKSADNGKVLTVNNGYPSWETAGGASVSPCLNLMDMSVEQPVVRTSITEEEKNNLDKGLYNSVYYYDESWGETAELSMMLPQLLTKANGMYIATIYTGLVSEGSGLISGLLIYIIEIGEKSTDDTYPLTIEKASEVPFGGGGGEVIGGVVKSLPFPQTINSEKGYNLLSPIIDAGEIVYAGNAVTDNNLGNFRLMLGLSSNVVPSAQGEQEYCNFDCIVKDMGIGRMSLKKDANNIPQFKSFTTWLPPVSANSEGKSLIVTNGNAQWTPTPRYEHTVTIKNSEGKILWTQTMRNSSNTVVNSYTNLKTLFGEATYAGFGEYCQLNLEGGTEATDKLIKADGTEVTLASLGAIVYTDKCFLPK